MCDARGTAHTGQKIVPIGVDIVSDGCHCTQSGYDYSAKFHGANRCAVNEMVGWLSFS